MKKLLMMMSVFAIGLGANAQITTNSSCDSNLNGTVSIEDVTNVANKVIGKAAEEKEVVTAEQVNGTLKSVETKLVEILGKLSALKTENNKLKNDLFDLKVNAGLEHAYVDLGLPSGTLWATCNVGASSLEEYGDYFAWGEVEPQDDNAYSWASYKWSNGGTLDYPNLTKYCAKSEYGYNGFTDTLTELESEDDAATVNWGSEWKMPSAHQIYELTNSRYTTATLTTENGVEGYKITSKKTGYTDRYIFLPAAGCRGDGKLFSECTDGYYWSSSLNTLGGSDYAYYLHYNYTDFGRSSHHRFSGRSIRPVRVTQKSAHEYVDLGLPSGTLWATCNLGASSPEEYGDYFAWGEVEPQDDNAYSWASYKWSNGATLDYPNLTKYCAKSEYGYNGFTDTLTELESEDDAATVNWGSEWQMPSSDQIDELTNNSYTTITLTTVNGVEGCKITSKKTGYTDRYIFLPAAGCRGDGTLFSECTDGYYWSSSLNTLGGSDYANYLHYNYTDFGRSSHHRFSGRSVRPVHVSTK